MKKPGNSPRMASADVHEAAPALGWYTDQILFGENWADQTLTPRDRSLVTVSALIARSGFQQLINHSKRAMANGVRPAELVELVAHMAFYAGWPCSMSAIATLRQVFTAEGIAWADVAADHDDTLPECCVTGGLPPAISAALDGEDVAALLDYTDRVIWNDLWQRKTLAPRDRSLATITALIGNGDLGQLPLHVGLGLRHGLTATELMAVLTHLAFYIGWPKAMAALPVLRAAIAAGPADI